MIISSGGEETDVIELRTWVEIAYVHDFNNNQSNLLRFEMLWKNQRASRSTLLDTTPLTIIETATIVIYFEKFEKLSLRAVVL